MPVLGSRAPLHRLEKISSLSKSWWWWWWWFNISLIPELKILFLLVYLFLTITVTGGWRSVTSQGKTRWELWPRMLRGPTFRMVNLLPCLAPWPGDFTVMSPWSQSHSEFSCRTMKRIAMAKSELDLGSWSFSLCPEPLPPESSFRHNSKICEVTLTWETSEHNILIKKGLYILQLFLGCQKLCYSYEVMV